MEYIKSVRAQLSNHEQLLLYYNSFAPFGNNWIDKRIFSKYRFIKNIPLQLLDFGEGPIAYFKLLAKEPDNRGFYLEKNLNGDINLQNEDAKEIFDSRYEFSETI